MENMENVKNVKNIKNIDVNRIYEKIEEEIRDMSKTYGVDIYVGSIDLDECPYEKCILGLRVDVDVSASMHAEYYVLENGDIYVDYGYGDKDDGNTFSENESEEEIIYTIVGDVEDFVDNLCVIREGHEEEFREKIPIYENEYIYRRKGKYIQIRISFVETNFYGQDVYECVPIVDDEEMEDEAFEMEVSNRRLW